MYLSKNVGDARFLLNDDGEKIVFNVENFSEPLRGYLLCEGKSIYAGLSKPSGSGSCLSFCYDTKPEKFIVTKGRLEDNHDTVCEFVLTRQETGSDCSETVKFVFSHPSSCDCIRYYGHFFVYEYENKKIFALPSDFEMHPVLHLIPFSWWYPVNLGFSHTGYYFFGVSDSETFFVDKKLLTEIIGNSKMEKSE